MERLEKVLKNAKNTISDEELQQIFRESDYNLFHTKVERLVESGVLSPVKSSKTNGRLPPSLINIESSNRKKIIPVTLRRFVGSIRV